MTKPSTAIVALMLIGLAMAIMPSAQASAVSCNAVVCAEASAFACGTNCLRATGSHSSILGVASGTLTAVTSQGTPLADNCNTPSPLEDSCGTSIVWSDFGSSDCLEEVTATTVSYGGFTIADVAPAACI